MTMPIRSRPWRISHGGIRRYRVRNIGDFSRIGGRRATKKRTMCSLQPYDAHWRFLPLDCPFSDVRFALPLRSLIW